MKSFLLIILAICPIVVFSQNVGIGTTQPSEKLEVNGIIFSKQGGVKFPDGSVQTTAYTPSVVTQVGLTGLVVEFAPGATIDIVGPANSGTITNGINVNSVQEGIGIGISSSNGVYTSSAPNFSEATFTRQADINSAQFRKVLATATDIPYIEVYYLKMYGATYFIDQITRFENCRISSFTSSSGGETPSESFSIIFLKSCYRSFKRDQNGVQLSVKDFCFNQPGNTSNCNCTFSN